MLNSLVKHRKNPVSLFNDSLIRFPLFDYDLWGDSGMTSPKANIYETETEYVIELLAPGMEKSGFKIGAVNNSLSVEYETKEEKNEKGRNWITREYTAQTFTRIFPFGETASLSSAEAEYRDGILRIRVPKKAEGLDKKLIEVK